MKIIITLSLVILSEKLNLLPGCFVYISFNSVSFSEIRPEWTPCSQDYLVPSHEEECEPHSTEDVEPPI